MVKNTSQNASICLSYAFVSVIGSPQVTRKRNANLSHFERFGWIVIGTPLSFISGTKKRFPKIATTSCRPNEKKLLFWN